MIITKKDIGREVVLRNGHFGTITDIYDDQEYPVSILSYDGMYYTTKNGMFSLYAKSCNDLIKFRPNTQAEWKKRALKAEKELSVLKSKMEEFGEQLTKLGKVL